ncbi:winged helix-turn-helix domain-containing protein [Streptomyces sp. NPDC088729]|uniref:winged helix-turn-helix domain-containing protein n=1 Tax=unclassified Streptomyces TaxID=2593676 RepID=UPI0019D2CEB6|nr:winged helix-turn-helix domain-containing protein [Streptomyces sp. ADI96-02]
MVEGGAHPPVCNDPFEDWVRAPISREDLDARVTALQNRLDSQQLPTLDSAGTLCFGPHSITISNVQTELMELLIEHFGEVVYRNELAQRLAQHVQRPTRNSLDLHIMRLRRRLSLLNLVIRTAWGRGYVLESETPQ